MAIYEANYVEEATAAVDDRQALPTDDDVNKFSIAVTVPL